MLSNCGAGEDSRESPEINPEYSLEKTLMLGKIEGRRKRGWTGWYGWMASLRQWTWLWANSRRYWRTGKPVVLQSMGLQRVRPDWATESESESHSAVSNSLQPYAVYSPWNSPGQNTGVGSLSLLQGMFPTQGLNPGLLHCSQILNQLSHQGSPRILEWVANPFFSRSSWPRNWTGVSCIAGRFLTNWAIREAPEWLNSNTKLKPRKKYKNVPLPLKVSKGSEKEFSFIGPKIFIEHLHCARHRTRKVCVSTGPVQPAELTTSEGESYSNHQGQENFR